MKRLLWLVLVVGCGGDDTARHPPDAPREQGLQSENVAGFVSSLDGFGYATGAFYAGPIEYPESCRPVTYGSCQLFPCASPAPTNTSKNAGDVTIAGGSPTQTFALTPTAANFYQTQQMNFGATFGPGTSIAFSATGGEFPAFSSTATMPTPGQFDAPVPGGTVSRTTDLAVAWSKTVNTDDVLLAIYAGSPTSEFISCQFFSTGTSGSGVVPAAALMALPAGPAVLAGAGYAIGNATAGSYAVTLYAGIGMYNAAHTTAFGGTVTLQ